MDRLLTQNLPGDLLAGFPDPTVTIEFGPPEDRFHMQLAIDARAEYPVSTDGGVLAEAHNMRRFDVRECHPIDYVDDQRALRRS